MTQIHAVKVKSENFISSLFNCVETKILNFSHSSGKGTIFHFLIYFFWSMTMKFIIITAKKSITVTIDNLNVGMSDVVFGQFSVRLTV